MRCPKCGAFLDEGRRECFMCGAHIEEENDFNNVQSKKLIKKRDKDYETVGGKKTSFGKYFVMIVLLLIVVLVVIFVILPIFKSDSNSFGNLKYINSYFEVNQEDDDFLKLGNKDCEIELLMGNNSDENYYATYFKEVLEKIDGDYETKDGNITLNGARWTYLNVSYKSDNGSYSILKYKYLVIINNGKFYNVKLVNTNNESQCALELDNFVNSFKFNE